MLRRLGLCLAHTLATPKVALGGAFLHTAAMTSMGGEPEWEMLGWDLGLRPDLLTENEYDGQDIEPETSDTRSHVESSARKDSS